MASAPTSRPPTAAAIALSGAPRGHLPGRRGRGDGHRRRCRSHPLLDVDDHVADRRDLGEIVVGNLEVEDLLDPEEELDHCERVQAEILPEVILQANLADVALEVLRERGANPGGDCRLRDHCMPPWTGWSGMSARLSAGAASR